MFTPKPTAQPPASVDPTSPAAAGVDLWTTFGIDPLAQSGSSPVKSAPLRRRRAAAVRGSPPVDTQADDRLTSSERRRLDRRVRAALVSTDVGFPSTVRI